MRNFFTCLASLICAMIANNIVLEMFFAGLTVALTIALKPLADPEEEAITAELEAIRAQEQADLNARNGEPFDHPRVHFDYDALKDK